MKNVKVIAIVHQNVIVKKHKQTVIKIVKKMIAIAKRKNANAIVQKNVIVKKIIAIAKRKNANAIAIKIASVQTKNVIADAKKVKNAHVNVAKTVIVMTANAVKRKNLNFLRKNVNAKKNAQKQPIVKNQSAIAKNNG